MLKGVIKMGFLWFGKKKTEQLPNDKAKYGKAWLLIAGERQEELGLEMMKELDASGFIEATIALAMFEEDMNEKKRLLKKAADAGNPEGLWEYTRFLPHSYCPNPNDPADALWEKYCTDAAERGSVDAMNELGNIFHRRKNYAESMYWYAMANANDQKDAQMSMFGITKEWKEAGCLREFVPGSAKFDKDRHFCAISLLEMYAGTNYNLNTKLEGLVNLVLKGVPLAGYIAADIFQNHKDEEMAYKMYNALAFEQDPHGLKCYADMLFSGKGISPDVSSAIEMYAKAARLGERSAMFIIAEFIKKKDKNLAAYWYGVSLTRGYAFSSQRLKQLASE